MSCEAAESVKDAIHDNRMFAKRTFYCMRMARVNSNLPSFFTPLFLSFSRLMRYTESSKIPPLEVQYMKYIQLGKSGLTVPSVALGCMRIRDVSAKEAEELVATALELGCNFLCTS